MNDSRKDEAGVFESGLAASGLAWWRSRGPATQGVVPGAYAWAVTIAPVGWSTTAPPIAAIATALGFLSLVVSPVIERRAPGVARIGLGWGLVVAAVLTWGFSPEASVQAFDAVRGISGMLGWALFAFAVASPARPLTLSRHVEPASRKSTSRVDSGVLFFAVSVALLLEVPGWRLVPRDRALLVRLVGIAGGLGIISVASAIAVGHHSRPRRARKVSLPSVFWLATACLLMGAGVAYCVWGTG